METKKKSGEVIVQTEIERKFLLPELPPEITIGILEGKFEYEDIEQGYTDDDARIRKSVNSKGETTYTKTRKKEIPGTGGIEKEEAIEILSREEFDRLWPLTEGARIIKKRYYVPLDGFTLHLDMFEGEFRGRVIGEVEFPSLEAARDFRKPPWFGEDITYITNKRLALHQQVLPKR